MFVFRDVSAGAHRIIAMLGDSEHVRLEPLAADTVHVMVDPARQLILEPLHYSPSSSTSLMTDPLDSHRGEYWRFYLVHVKGASFHLPPRFVQGDLTSFHLPPRFAERGT